MLSSSNLMAAPEEAAKQIDHLFVFLDTDVLSGGGRGRFATDLFTLSVTRDDSGGARGSLAPPRSGFTPRPRPFHGVVAGLRLSSRPKHLPESEVLDMLASERARVQTGDGDLPALIAVLDGLAKGMGFATPPGALRALSVPRRFDLSLQDTRLKDRPRLVIYE